ncbi:MAG TPA: flagellar basal body rod protein FlgB [Baekduia sp.]|uniref:flagellar basal body rod protein FlgB n=1 Tax=Baekduia sp. TaxID=2600305 RepID=UPI002D780CEA|nr:flagellar basal body rod protein FlgB [Baekduia sp.]HET6508855.1 flagellar basal body rod protein FlgB [Baekduia sp.]
MELFDTTQIGLERALSGSSLRQQAIAQNIANVNTPGYRRQDVDFASALHQAWNEGERGVEAVQPQTITDTSTVMRADGSSVDIDTEAAEQAKNGLTYEAVSQIMKTRTAIIKSAIGTV